MYTAYHQERFLTVADVAELLDVAPITVRRKIESGEIPAVQLGGPGSAIRVPAGALDEWLERGRTA